MKKPLSSERGFYFGNMKNNSNYLKMIIPCFVSAFIGAGAIYLAAPYLIKSDETKIIDEAKAIIEKNGDPDFDYNAASSGIVNGYLNSGGDKYTYYTDSEDDDSEQETFMTAYLNASPTCLGSGLKVEKSKNGNILIMDVKEDYPAEAQGLREKDEIIAIDGVSISEKGYSSYANKLLGKPDTIVRLTILRDEEQFDLDFKRVNEEVGEAIGRQYGNTVYLKINSFDEFTVPDVDKVLKENNSADSVIIDLRGCPGGLTSICFDIAGRFVESGTARFERFNGEITTYNVEPNISIPDASIIVLIDDETMSAAEIMTALIKDNAQNCTLVGKNTFGKGIFQMEESLKNGGTLHYTAGKFYVDERENWHGKGIAPDIEVPMDKDLIGTDDDIQLKKALELLD